MNLEPPTAEPQSWPVLAHLPRLGAAVPGSESDAQPPRAGVHTAPSGRQFHAVDQSHSARGYDGPASNDVSFTHLKVEPGPAPAPTVRQRRLRIDARAPRQLPARHQRAEPESLTGALLRLHEAITPYLGLVAAAAFVISGALLYWSAFGKPQTAPTPPHGSVEKSTWASELPSPECPLPSPAAASVDPNPPVTAVQQDDGTRVADATASQQDLPATEAAKPSSAAAPAAPRSDGPSLTPAAPDAEMFNKSAATPVDEPITPTPHTDAYPTTPYAAFWWLDPAAVALRPMTADLAAPR